MKLSKINLSDEISLTLQTRENNFNTTTCGKISYFSRQLNLKTLNIEELK
jgi:hypothetical protein